MTGNKSLKDTPQVASDMGGALSTEEKRLLLPQLQSFGLDTLSTIIWDTINLVGVDDQREKFGIHFDEPEEENPKEQEEKPKEEQEKSKQRKQQMVTFWDGENAQTVPFPIFADIVIYVGEEKVKVYEEKHDPKEGNDTTAGLSKLKLALEYLKGKVEREGRLETAAEYRSKLDRERSWGAICKDKLVDSARERRGTQMWSAGKAEPKKEKGIQSMVNRHPELQQRKNHFKKQLGLLFNPEEDDKH